MGAVRWLKNLWSRRRLDGELDAEIHAYVDLLSDEYRERGYSADEAGRRARLQLGGIEPVKEQVRAVRSGASLEALWRDVAFGLRTLRKSPSFAGTATYSTVSGASPRSASLLARPSSRTC